jgi:hypothetical protein
MPKAQNRHPTKSSSVLQVLECKKVSSLTSKGRNIYILNGPISAKNNFKIKKSLHDSKIISRNFKSLTQNQIIELDLPFNSVSLAF